MTYSHSSTVKHDGKTTQTDAQELSFGAATSRIREMARQSVTLPVTCRLDSVVTVIYEMADGSLVTDTFTVSSVSRGHDVLDAANLHNFARSWD